MRSPCHARHAPSPKVLRRHGCIVRPNRLPPQPMERPALMSAWQIDAEGCIERARRSPWQAAARSRNLERGGYGHLHRPRLAGVRQFSCADGTPSDGHHPAPARKTHPSSFRTLFEHLEEKCLLASLGLKETRAVMRIESHTILIGAIHHQPFQAQKAPTVFT